MKIGIITEPAYRNNVNFGCSLQAVALNKYLNNMDGIEAETLFFDAGYINNYKYVLSWGLIKKCLNVLIKKLCNTNEDSHSIDLRKTILFNRMCNVIKFTINNLAMSKTHYDIKKLKESDYDMFITGSDIVWGQVSFGVNFIKFLGFDNKSNAKKVSYAASFGRDWIPKANRKVIRNFLSKYSYISVREKSSINMLKDLSIDNVTHVCDPVMLFSCQDWASLEEKIQDKSIGEKTFVFSYLLGNGGQQRDKISLYAKLHNKILVTIPYANGLNNNVDSEFGDIQVVDCSPGNFLWLIHHADIIFTDSFHCLCFSLLYHTKFIALRREYRTDINNRIYDILNLVKMGNFFVTSIDEEVISDMDWNWDIVDYNLKNHISQSKNFLNTSVEIIR